MKQSISLTAVAFLLLASCQLQDLTVKTNPSIQVPAGSYNVDFSTLLSADKLRQALGSVGTAAGFTITSKPVPDNAGNTVQAFTLEYTDKAISFPLSNFFGTGSSFDLSALNLGSSTAPLSGGFTVPNIPSTAVPFNATIPFAVTPPAGFAFGPQTVSGTVAVPLGTLGATFVSADINTGNLTLDLPDPAGYTLTARSLKISISQNSVPLFTQTQTNNGAYAPFVFNLASMAIKTGDLSLTYDYTVSGTTGSGSGAFSGSATMSVSKLANIVVNDPTLAQLFKPVVNTTAYDANLKKFISSITLDNTGPYLTGSFTNNLPFGLTITLNSTTLGITNAVTNVPNNNTAVPFSVNGVKNVIQPAVENNFDFSFQVGLGAGGSFNATTGYLTIAGPVTANQAYTYSGTYGVKVKPTQAVIGNTSITGQSFPVPPAPAIDLSGLGKFLPAGVKFKNVDLTLSLSATGIKNLNATLNLKPTYTTPVVSTESPTAVNLTTDATGTANTAASTPIDLSTTLNNRPSDLRLNYDFTVNGATVDLTTVSTAALSASFKLSIPFTWTIDATTNPNGIDLSVGLTPNPLDFSAATGSNKDLFGRTVVNPDDQITKILNSLQTGSIDIVGINNTTGIAFDFYMDYPDPVNSGNPDIHSYLGGLPLTGKVSTASLKATDIQAMKSGLFKPKFRIIMPAGTYVFGANPTLNLGLNIKLQTAVDQTIKLK